MEMHLKQKPQTKSTFNGA